jgi:TPR repeat protein
MRMFSMRVAALALLAILTVGFALPSGGGAASLDRDVVAAYNASKVALKRRDFARAIPDLKYAADHGVFLAQYYLARLYAMPDQSFTDNARAFEMLRKLVKKNASIDPYVDQRAPFVAKAELLLSYYYRRGVPELSMPANAGIAKGHLENAALRLGDTDAQFELGLIDLESDETVARGLDTLDNLAVSKRHAAAAAEIARVYSQGRLTDRVPSQALGYAMLAAKRATGQERLEIGSLYQTLYCQSSTADRSSAETVFRELDQSATGDSDEGTAPIVRSREKRVDGVLDLAEVSAVRVCANGDIVPEPGQASGAMPAPNSQRRVIAGCSAVGCVRPPMGIGLQDLEQPGDLSDESNPADEEEPGLPSN